MVLPPCSSATSGSSSSASSIRTNRSFNNSHQLAGVGEEQPQVQNRHKGG